MTTYKGPEWAIGLQRHLENLQANNEAMAELRRGRGKNPDDCVEMHRWVSQFVSERQLGTGREWAVYTVASEFALHKDLHSCDESLGWSLAKAAGHGSLSEVGLERRLLQLIRSRNNEELCRRLPRVLSLVASEGVPISWPRLAGDVDRWDNDKGVIAKRWLRDFFNRSNNPQEPDAAAIIQGAI